MKTSYPSMTSCLNIGRANTSLKNKNNVSHDRHEIMKTFKMTSCLNIKHFIKTKTKDRKFSKSNHGNIICDSIKKCN